MTIDTLIRHSAELLRIIIKSRQAADTIVNDYFRSKKYIGSKERQFISGLIFSTLRNLTLFQYLTKDSPVDSNLESTGSLSEEHKICLSSFLLSTELTESKGFFHFKELIGRMNDGQIDHAYNQITQTNLELKNYIINNYNNLENLIDENDSLNNRSIELISARYSMSEWIVRNWAETYSLDKKELILILDCLTRPADIFIRVNTNKASRYDVIGTLKDKGIACSATELSPSCVKIYQRANLKELEIFRDGTIEVQDEGSQLIGYALSPKPGDKILDACAGAGGKTLHMADLSSDRASILATDTDLIGLRELGKRASRGGFRSIRTQLIKTGKPLAINSEGRRGLFDSVLVDAPCSGMGTVRRMPMQKYRLNEALLAKHAKKQLELLNNYSQYVNEGGILVYSTCSLMPQENSEVVQKFLSLHPDFKADPLQPVFSEHGIHLQNLPDDCNTLTLFPHIHGTDGFFMARFVKSSV